MAETRRTTRVPKTAKTKPVDEYGHLQPQAPELEEAVLGALMIEKDAYSLVSEILRPESFYEHRNQLIYAAITDLAIQQKPIDIYHARIIAQKFLARELISFTSAIQTKAFDETQDVDDLMQEAEGKLFEPHRWVERAFQRVPSVGQNDFGMAELRFDYHSRPSGDG